MNNIKGFTLIELMITIGIVAIITTMAAPAFSNLVAKQKLDASARSLILVFGDARAKAATLRRMVTVTPTAGTNTEILFHWASKYEDIQLINGTQSVSFNENGLARRVNVVANVETEIPLNFQLCSTRLKQSKTVALSRTGVVEAIRDSGAC
ncbi:Tfp pilus assembly protein FimT/FimU [Acinetobacter portensis]|uniref:pilus assembly FimT family protein n=1 Tax=Acinetobacter portensis TaxID=1839785 RepID=UPI00128E8E7F|nr:prepilin-type N-terminal cleavage/methylation domain-containing protein [Acinetobacter portensis]